MKLYKKRIWLEYKYEQQTEFIITCRIYKAARQARKQSKRNGRKKNAWKNNNDDDNSDNNKRERIQQEEVHIFS